MLYASGMDARPLLVFLSFSGLAAQGALGAESIDPCPTFEGASVNCFPSEEEPALSITDIKSEELGDFTNFRRCQRRMAGRMVPPALPVSEKVNLKIAGSTEGVECTVDLKFEISRWGRVREIESLSECPDLSALEQAAIKTLESSRFRKGFKALECTHTMTFKFR